MQDEIKECHKNIERAQAWDKLYVDQQRRPRNFQVGDMVYLRVKSNSSLKIGRCTKLSPHFCGPFEVLEKINEVAYILKLPSHVKMHTLFHVSYLKKALSRFDNTFPTYVDV